MTPNRYTVTLDDDPMVSRLIEQATGMKSIAFLSARSLLGDATGYHPVAVFVDINLGVDECGLDIIPQLRALWHYAPIIVITADPKDEAVSRALHCGADDFIQKPIRPNELIARLQTRLADLAGREQKNIVRYQDLSLDCAHRLVQGPRGECYLSPIEARLLQCLIEAKGTVVAKDRLRRCGWKQVNVSENALVRQIFSLRQSLTEISERVRLKSVYGQGLALRTKECTTSSAEIGPSQVEAQETPGRQPTTRRK